MRSLLFKMCVGFASAYVINSSFAQSITYAGIFDSTMHFRIIFNPPKLLTANDSLFVDANNDGINDFKLYTREGELAFNCFGEASYITSVNGISQIASKSNLIAIPYEFHYSDSLIKSDSLLLYGNVEPWVIALHIPPCAIYDSWVNNDSYIGFRILNAPDTLYGWIDPFLSAADSLNIFEIVCESLNPGTIYINDIHELRSQPSATVYPNPFMTRLTVGSKFSGQLDFFLYDITGRQLIQQSFAGYISLNTENISKGIYTYEIKTRNSVLKHGKLIKE